MTVDDIAAQARLSRKTFYELFKDKEDCFLAAYRAGGRELAGCVAAVTPPDADWPEQLRAALGELLAFLAARPDLAHLAVVEVLAAGPRALAERDRMVRSLAHLGDRAIAVAPGSPPALLLEMIAGGISELIYGWVQRGRATELEELLPMIMYFVLTPFYGPAAAAVKSGLQPSAPTIQKD
jgi:AcrR family transcriptional regulator